MCCQAKELLFTQTIALDLLVRIRTRQYSHILCGLLKCWNDIHELIILHDFWTHEVWSWRTFWHREKKYKRQWYFSISDLAGSSGRIRSFAQNNLDVIDKDLRTLQNAFEFYDCKKFFADYFLPCNGIQSWHIIKIKEDGPNIMVANNIGDELQEYKILKKMPNITMMPSAINPEGCSEDRLSELEYFKEFTYGEHKSWIFTNYWVVIM